jgi:hypothetical protein
MDHILDFASLVKQKERSRRKNLDPAPENPVHGIITKEVKICTRKMIRAGIAKNIFIFPEGIAATAANPWKDQAKKIICPHSA